LTYGTAYGHEIRIAFPPEDVRRVRSALAAAARRMGCATVAATDTDGQRIWT